VFNSFFKITLLVTIYFSNLTLFFVFSNLFFLFVFCLLILFCRHQPAPFHSCKMLDSHPENSDVSQVMAKTSRVPELPAVSCSNRIVSQSPASSSQTDTSVVSHNQLATTANSTSSTQPSSTKLTTFYNTVPELTNSPVKKFSVVSPFKLTSLEQEPVAQQVLTSDT